MVEKTIYGHSQVFVIRIHVRMFTDPVSRFVTGFEIMASPPILFSGAPHR